MDVGQALRDTENSLRDFIAQLLEKRFGSAWVESSGVTKDRIESWNARREEEKKKQQFGSVDPRLIYYADFYDLRTILSKHWQEFSPALGEKKIFDVWLNELERFRNPDAHQRDLLPHQKHLALGIEGEIRSRIVRYRSKLETTQDYFPRIEHATDSLGNVYTPASVTFKAVFCQQVLHPGDKLDFVITAKDPLEEELRFSFWPSTNRAIEWQSENSWQYTILEADIGAMFSIVCCIRSNRAHTAAKHWDDLVEFTYPVLPMRSPMAAST